MDKIRIVDGIMGSGKSTWAFNHIVRSVKADSSRKFIYVTPLKAEIRRAIKACHDIGLVEPLDTHGTKMSAFIKLIEADSNIATSHSLFLRMDNDVISLIASKGYELIVDETLDLINELVMFPDEKDFEKSEILTGKDIQAFIDSGLIRLEPDTERIIMVEDTPEFLKYQDVVQRMKLGNVYALNKRVLLEVVNPEIFLSSFESIHVMTFRFEWSLMGAYFRKFGIEYEYWHLSDSETGLSSGEKDISDDIESIKSLIEICEVDKLNRIGDLYWNNRKDVVALSKKFYDSKKTLTVKHLKRSAKTVRDLARSKGYSQILWSTFKDYTDDLLKSRVLRQSDNVAINTRGLNSFDNRDIVMYFVNRYYHPSLLRFLNLDDSQVTHAEVVLSEFLQFFFRSAIRRNEHVYVYIPSVRMRTIFKSWLNNKGIFYYLNESRRKFNSKKKLTSGWRGLK